jgi:hypothetical protein
MERVGTLIHKLQEQFEQQQDSHKLLLTAQMLIAELQQQQMNNNTGKVSVTMPFFTSYEQQPILETASVVEAILVKKIAEPMNANIEEAVKEKTLPAEALATQHSSWLFDPVMVAVPTLAHHTEEPINVLPAIPKIQETAKEVLELKDTIITENETESFNEKLKEEKKEVAAVLQGTPVKDLRKAIGINDRYLFINELFRGDENMYERSLKTINGFTIYPEAEYWIQRELKVKLGWLEEQETVKVFDQLVKRRFS